MNMAVSRVSRTLRVVLTARPNIKTGPLGDFPVEDHLKEFPCTPVGPPEASATAVRFF